MAVTIGISITQNSQSIENNTSNVTVKVTAKWTYGSWNATGKCYGSIVIDGTTYSFTGIKFNSNATTSGSQTIMTKTVDVSHTADGSKKLSCSASFYTGLSSSGTQKASASKELTTIPRATTPVISGALSLGSTITIDTSSRASTGFTHNLYYSWGSQVIDNLVAHDVITSTTWQIPKRLAEYIQAGTSGTMFLKCVTYSGSTEIGSTTLTLTIAVPDTAEFQPTIQSVSMVDANSLPLDRYIVGKSQLKFTISAVGGYVDGRTIRNSYLKSASIVVDGVSYPVTLGVNAASTFEVTTNLIAKSGTFTATVIVTDSRERTARKDFTYTAYDYFAPEITAFTARRCLQDGTLDDSGTYILFGIRTTIASVDNVNAKMYKIVYENNGSEVTLKSGNLAEYTNSGLDYNTYSDGVTFSVDNSWVVRVYVYDSFNSSVPAVATVIVPTEATFMDWRTNGKGFAFGKVSIKDAFECAWPMFDRFDTSISNGLVQYGDIDPNTTLEHQILTNINTPESGLWYQEFWYITTLFYSTKSDSSNRVQFAMPYSYAGPCYMRYYYGGTWSAWLKNEIVIESGTSGIWTYKKYASGEAECWGRVGVTTGVTSAWGSLFTSGALSGSNVAFPFTFAEEPTVNVTLSGSSVGGFLMVTGTQAGGTTTTQTGHYEICRGSSLTSGNFVLNYHAKGRWG